MSEARGIEIGRVAKIVPRVSVKHAAVMPFHRPSTALEAKFSLEFAAACALKHGAVGLDQLTDRVVRDPSLQDLMRRVEIETTEDYDPHYAGAARADVVRVHLDDGRVLESPAIARASGHADRPLSAAELRQKFDACARAGGVDAGYAGALFAAMQRIDSLGTVADIPDRPTGMAVS